jgi:hypothetical protein
MFPEGLNYAIAPSLRGWRWTVYAADGSPRARGEASSRALAAACVVRCISRAAAPADVTSVRRAA